MRTFIRKTLTALTIVFSLVAMAFLVPTPAQGAPSGTADISQTDTTSTDVWMAALPPGFAENQDALMSFNDWLASQDGLPDAGYVAAIEDD